MRIPDYHNIIDFVRNEKWQSALSKVHYIPAYLAQTTPKSVINVDAADADDILHTVQTVCGVEPREATTDESGAR